MTEVETKLEQLRNDIGDELALIQADIAALKDDVVELAKKKQQQVGPPKPHSTRPDVKITDMQVR